MKKHIANIITGLRILCSILLLFFPVPSSGFFILYLLCGFSDMADGIIARKTNTASEFGARLDSVSDIIFLATAMIKLLPVFYIPEWLWIWIAGIGIVKAINIAAGFITRKKLIFLHTILNKATGLLLFLLPLTLHFFDLRLSSAVLCFIASVSAIQEGYLIVSGHDIL